MKPILHAWPALVLALGSAVAQAQDNVAKFGVTRYDTHSKTSGIAGIGIPPGADASTGDATTWLLTYERMVTPQIGVELVAGKPPKITAQATGSVAFLGEVMSAHSVSPTVLVNWHFGAPGALLRPYVGAGINYTKFTGVRSNYPWQVGLSDSVGPAVQAGLDVNLSGAWVLWASVAMVKVKSDLVAVGATVLQTTIDFRPRVYSAGVGYRF